MTAGPPVAPSGPSGGADEAEPGRPRASFLMRALGNRNVEASLTFAAFVVLLLIYSIWLGANFTNAEARLLDLHQNVPVLLLGLAAMIVLLSGQFDLSIASMATLTTFLAVGLKAEQDWPFAVVILACLAVGLIGGLLNGFLVEYLHINAFIATIATFGVFLGFSQVYSEGAQVVPTREGPQLPDWFRDLGSFVVDFPTPLLAAVAILAVIGAFLYAKRLQPSGWSDRRWLATRAVATVATVAFAMLVLDFGEWIDKASWAIILILGVSFLLWILVQYTTFGRYLRATGANREAARLAGVSTRRETIISFVLSGMLSALAGIMIAANQGAASPNIAGGLLLPAFAAAFLSTVIFSTGQFTVWGTVIGGIFVVWVSQGLILGGLDTTWTDVVNGTMLVLAVSISTVLGRLRTR